MPRNLIHAEAIADYRGVLASPGAILMEGDVIVEVGTPQEIGQINDAGITHVDGMVTPSFVNAHAHLDLSGAGNSPPEDSFIDWLLQVVRPIRLDESCIQESVNLGIKLSLLGGCRVVGDIAGTMLAADIVDSSDLLSVSFVELIGLGKRQSMAIEKLHSIPDKYEVTPHAPYSCGEDVYRACFESGKRVATHLSESTAELDFMQHHGGEFVEALIKLGVWDETIEPWGQHPIDAVLGIGGASEFISAHLNYIEDRHLPMLASSNMTVAYCPRASHYFGHQNHRWKEMVEAGVNVALGTDSLLCIDAPDRLSVLDEIRFLYQRDGYDPEALFSMATINGSIGLGMDPTLVTLEKGEVAGLLKFEGLLHHSLAGLFESEVLPIWLH